MYDRPVVYTSVYCAFKLYLCRWSTVRVRQCATPTSKRRGTPSSTCRSWPVRKRPRVPGPLSELQGRFPARHSAWLFILVLGVVTFFMWDETSVTTSTTPVDLSLFFRTSDRFYFGKLDWIAFSIPSLSSTYFLYHNVTTCSLSVNQRNYIKARM